MSKLTLFDYYILKDFYNKYNVNSESLKENIYYFRYLCMKMNCFMKNMVLPKFKKDSLYESVIVEFREFPHLEFIIRNTIYKLGTLWSHTVICGNKNYDMINNMCKKISNNIKIIKLDIFNMTQSDYSQYLMTKDFWNLLKGEKILIYQEDSMIFKNNIEELSITYFEKKKID